MKTNAIEIDDVEVTVLGIQFPNKERRVDVVFDAQGQNLAAFSFTEKTLGGFIRMLTTAYSSTYSKAPKDAVLQ